MTPAMVSGAAGSLNGGIPLKSHDDGGKQQWNEPNIAPASLAWPSLAKPSLA